jgi:hypothetical protein
MYNGESIEMVIWILKNERDFFINKNNSFISGLLKLLWKNELFLFRFDENRINIFDFIKLLILSKILYLVEKNELDYKIIFSLQNDLLLEEVEKVFSNYLLWKSSKLKLWININSKFWFELDWNKERVFLRWNEDFFIEINLSKILKFKKQLFLKNNYNYWNKYTFDFKLNSSQIQILDKNLLELRENINEFNTKNWENYTINWNFKDWILKNSDSLSWL